MCWCVRRQPMMPYLSIYFMFLSYWRCRICSFISIPLKTGARLYLYRPIAQLAPPFGWFRYLALRIKGFSPTVSGPTPVEFVTLLWANRWTFPLLGFAAGFLFWRWCLAPNGLLFQHAPSLRFFLPFGGIRTYRCRLCCSTQSFKGFQQFTRFASHSFEYKGHCFIRISCNDNFVVFQVVEIEIISVSLRETAAKCIDNGFYFFVGKNTVCCLFLNI